MSAPVVNNISLQDLKAGLADGSIALIDVREDIEWNAGHIPGAIFNPMSAFDASALPVATPGKKVIVHCRSGRRSITALGLAQAAGRTDVNTHFEGGMLEWVGAGEPVAQG